MILFTSPYVQPQLLWLHLSAWLPLPGGGVGCWPEVCAPACSSWPWLQRATPGLLRGARAFLISTFLMSLGKRTVLSPPMGHHSAVGFPIPNIPFHQPHLSAQHFFSPAGHHLFQVSKEPSSSVILARVLGPVSGECAQSQCIPADPVFHASNFGKLSHYWGTPQLLSFLGLFQCIVSSLPHQSHIYSPSLMAFLGFKPNIPCPCWERRGAVPEGAVARPGTCSAAQRRAAFYQGGWVQASVSGVSTWMSPAHASVCQGCVARALTSNTGLGCAVLTFMPFYFIY